MAREVERSYLDKNYDESRFWTAIPLSITARNCQLEMKYSKKKEELRTQGRTEEELSDRTLFGCCGKYEEVEAVSESGLQCGMTFLNSCLGNASKGVSLGKHADVLLRKRFDDGLQSCWMIIFKVMYGRVKGVLPIQTPPYREPALDADCHCSFISPSVDDPLHLQEIKSQVYLFERNPVLPTSFSEQPRQCVPVAVVMYNRVGSLTDAVDLRLGADDHTRCSRTKPPGSADRGGGGDVSVVVGQCGRRRVVVSRSEKALVDDIATKTSHRTVLSCPSGTITKITINNDRERSNVLSEGPASALQQSTSASPSPVDTKAAVVLASTATAATSAETPVGNTRSQYSHLIRRRRKVQSIAVSPQDQTQSIQHPATDQTSPPLPRDDDTPLTLLQRQKMLVSDCTRKLSIELSAVTSFLRVTKPAHVDDRERVAMQSMQLVNAAFQRLTPVCLAYRQFCRQSTCSELVETGPPDVDALRVHDLTLRRCRERLASSFGERRNVIMQTPIAGEQRLFIFVWLQRHATTIIDCINVVIDVLKAVLPPPTKSIQTSTDTHTATSNTLIHHGEAAAPNSVDMKPNISRLEGGRVQVAGSFDELPDDARPPSLIPALKTDVVGPAEEPPVLQPCNYPFPHERSNRARSPGQPCVTATTQPRHLPDDHRCLNVPETQRVRSSSPDRSVVSGTRSLALKQELQETISSVQSCSTSTDTVPGDSSEKLDRLELEDHRCVNGTITDTPGGDADSKKDEVMRDEHVHEQILQLLDARDQKAFSRLLIDSVCSMPTDDFHRVREKLIKKFINDQRRAAAACNDQITAKIEKVRDDRLESRTQAEGEAAGHSTTNDDDENSSALSLKIVNVRSCGVKETDESWSYDGQSLAGSSTCDHTVVKRERLDSSSWSRDVVSGDDDNIIDDVTSTNYITIAPIEATTNDDDNTATEYRHDDQTQRQYGEATDASPVSAACPREPGYADVQAQRSQADVDDDARNESTDSRGTETQRLTSGDAEMTSPQTDVPATTSSRRRKANRRSGRRCPTLSATVDSPWLYPSTSPQNDHSSMSSVAVRNPFPCPPPFIRHYSYPQTSLPSPLKHRRCTDVRDRERRGHEPAWMSEMTPRQQHGAMSLHCCVAIVSRCLHAAGARHYAERVAEEREHRRRLTNELDANDDEQWTNHAAGVDGGGQSSVTPVSDRCHDLAVARHYGRSQPTRSVVVRDSRKETSARARSRSDSDSDTSRRPQVRDLRYRPKYTARGAPGWRGLPYSRRTTPHRRSACDLDAWRDRRRQRHDNYDRRSTNSRSAVERKATKKKVHRHSVSSERSSSSSSSSRSRSRSNSKDRCFRTKRASADEHSDEKTEGMKSVEQSLQTATDNRDVDATKEREKNTRADTSLDIGGKGDHALKIDKVNEYHVDNNSDKHCSSSSHHGEAALDIGEASSIENKVFADSSSTKILPSENCMTPSGGLSDTKCRSKTPATDNREFSKVKREDTSKHSSDSCSTKKPGEGDSECSSSRMSPSGSKHRHSRSGSRPRSGNSRTSVEMTQSGNSHDHRSHSTSEGREREKRHSSGKRSRSHSRDGRKRKSSNHGVDHEHRTKSRHDQRKRKRSLGRRRSRSSSRRRNSSSDNDRCSAKRNRKRQPSNTEEDQSRLKSERKRLEKLRKKAKKTLQKLQQLELNYEETHPHRKKSRSKETSKPSASTTMTSASQDKDLLDVNSNKRDWKCTSDQSATAVDVDFIALYTSPVSSPSLCSDAERNFCDEPGACPSTLSEKLYDSDGDLPDGVECGLRTCDNSEQATAVMPPSCTAVANSIFVSTTAADQCRHVQLFNSDFSCDSTMTTNETLQTPAVDDQTVQLDSGPLQIPVHITNLQSPNS